MHPTSKRDHEVQRTGQRAKLFLFPSVALAFTLLPFK
jgi:hypothetical protein